MVALQDYTRLKRGGRAANPVDSDDLAWSLVLDSLVFAAEAEIRWLDHCEARVRRAALDSLGLRAKAGRLRPAVGEGGDPMSTLLELELAARLKKAEDRWLAECDTRLRRATSSVVEEVAQRPSRNHPSEQETDR